MEELQVKGTYSEFKEQLDTELKKSVESFVRIGYLLKIARDTEILYESGYPSVVEFAKAEYNLSKDQVSRFIAINDKYSVDGYSDKLQDKYEGYGVAKLAEMLTLPEAVADMIEPEMTRAEIQEIKREVKEEQEISDIEVMLEEKDTRLEDMNLIQKFMYQYFYENRLDFIGMAAVIQGELETTDQEIEETLQVLAPSGITTKKVRIAGIGKLFLSIKGKDNNLELVNVRTNEKEDIAWKSFMDDIEQIYENGVSKEAWEGYYHESFEEKKVEVAPVQQESEQKRNDMAAEQNENIEDSQIPGQMNVYDYPELQPGEERNVDNSMNEPRENVEKIKCETNFEENVQDVDKKEQILDVESREIVENTECEDAWGNKDEIDLMAVENSQALVRAIATKDYEAANYILDTLKKEIEMLIKLEKTECKSKCVGCKYFGRACDAPETVEEDCMWQPSEENGWILPCEND